MAKDTRWTCAENCGACCKLDPEQRQEALMALSPDEQNLYLSMVGEDGWCRHFDKVHRKCTIYSQRPSFCNVKELSSIFHIAEENFNHFAISCCKQQIRSLYGGRSMEMRHFKKVIYSINNSK